MLEKQKILVKKICECISDLNKIMHNRHRIFLKQMLLVIGTMSLCPLSIR